MSDGLAIHIGMNEVDPRAYAGWDGALDAAENDANAMAALSRGLGFRRRVLTSAGATAHAVFAAIGSAAGALDDGDICLLTYAGHGGRFPDLTGDEGDRSDETWLLYDREVLDDEIGVALCAFRPGVRIVVVSDSCHSGTVIRDFYRRSLGESPHSRAAYARVGERRRARTRTGRPGTLRIRAAPDDVQAEVLARHGDVYRGIRDSTPSRPADRMAASAILLAGCQDNQASLEFDGHGVFTAALLDRLGDGSFGGDYRELIGAIRSDLPPSQSPNYLATGAPWPAFEQQVPFTVDAPEPDGQPGPATDDPEPARPPEGTALTVRVELSFAADGGDLGSQLRRTILDALRASTAGDPPADDVEIKI